MFSKKMHLFCFTLLLAAWTFVSASPLPADLSFTSAAQSTITIYVNENDGLGNYRFGYETSDGIKRDETGTLVNAGQPDAHIEVVGSYSYLRPDGKFEYVSYSADKNGYVITNESDDKMLVSGAIVATLLG